MKTLKQFIDSLVEETEGGPKVDRSAFIYLPPLEPKKDFAQCGTCFLFLPNKQRCGIFGPNDKVVANASCGLYLHGQPYDEQPIRDIVTPKEAGYVKEKVRCENCKWLSGTTCDLFKLLNKTLPDTFNLDEKVDRRGCCNAWQK